MSVLKKRGYLPKEVLKNLHDLSLEQEKYHIDELIRQLNTKQLLDRRVLLRHLKLYKPMGILQIQYFKRVLVFSQIKVWLNYEFLPYDASFYDKTLSVITYHDKQYSTEEKLLELAVVICTGMTVKQIVLKNYQPNARILRTYPAKHRLITLIDILKKSKSSKLLR